jgi:NAD(P)H-hydrate epimerase
LITLLVDPEIYPIVAGAASPEVMVKPLGSPSGALDMGFDVLALGPGLGKRGAADVRSLAARWTGPMVIDADGLNMLAEDMQPLLSGAGPRLLTPHPGEMKRLLHGAQIDEKMSREQTVRAFTERYPVTLLLKGARTLIGEAGRPLAYNSTGNAGMASGGMGDVLTGLCAGLAGQKLSLFDAARLGAWLHGRAADIAVRLRRSEQSLLATDLPAYFGAVFKEIRHS